MTIKHPVAVTASEPLRSRVSIDAYYDLALLASLALALPALVLLPLPLLRVPLGLALVLIAPGYTFTSAIFARHDDLDGVTRLALSFGLSVAVLPLLALALDLSPWGIRLWPMTLALASWIGVWSGIAALRRSMLVRKNAAMLPPPLAVRSRWSALTRRQRLGYTASTLGGIGLLLWIIVVLPVLTARTTTTEFYVLGSEGLAEAYPHAVGVGSQMQVQIGIQNHEGVPVTYRIEVYSGTTQLTRIDGIRVAAEANWEQPLRYTLTQAGDDQRIDILLFREPETTPYRRLQLWVNVQETLP